MVSFFSGGDPKRMPAGLSLCAARKRTNRSRCRSGCGHRRKQLLGPGAQAPHFYDHGTPLIGSCSALVIVPPNHRPLPPPMILAPRAPPTYFDKFTPIDVESTGLEKPRTRCWPGSYRDRNIFAGPSPSPLCQICAQSSVAKVIR